jgi:hypothetical protein
VLNTLIIFALSIGFPFILTVVFGLLIKRRNSTLDAGENAVIQNALPIAQQDAQAYNAANQFSANAANQAAQTNAPANPHTPKSTKNNNSSRPEANPAPTITPTNAPAIFSCSGM